MFRSERTRWQVAATCSGITPQTFVKVQQVEQNQIRSNLCDFLWQENSVVGSILKGDLSLWHIAQLVASPVHKTDLLPQQVA